MTISFPASRAQQRLWLLEQLSPDAVLYGHLQVWTVTGALDVEVLRGAVRSLVERHEVLRTTFGAQDDEIVQIIAESAEPDFREVSVGSLGEALRLAQDLGREAYDLTSGPLFTFAVFAVGTETHVIAMRMHHTITDGWTIRLLCEELSALYAGRELAEVGLQYADWATWRRDQPDSDLEAVCDRLKNLDLVGEIGGPRKRPARFDPSGATTQSFISGALWERVGVVARQFNVTPFAVALSAAAVVLRSWTAHSTVVVGTPYSGRDRPELEAVAGFFATTLVLAIDLRGDPTVDELIARTWEALCFAQDHPDLSFEALAEVVAPERDLSRNPVFQTLIAFQDFGRSAPRFENAEVKEVPVGEVAAAFDLAIEFVPGDDGVRVDVLYATCAIESAAAEAIAVGVVRVLEGVCSDAGARMSALGLAPELRRPTKKLITDVVEQIRAQDPDAIAVVGSDSQLTFGQLTEAASRTAGGLASAGVRPGDLVGIRMPRGIDQVVAMVGVLWAGAAYLPLDPAWPDERQEMIIADARPVVVLTSLLDGPTSAPATTDSADPAYVIFTSGTTGHPKGVVVPRGALSNLVDAQRSVFDVRPDDRVLQFASCGFDACVSEVFVTLCAGAQLHTGADVAPGPGLVAALVDRRITSVTLPPAVLQVLSPEQFSDLRTVVSAGESCPKEVVAAWSPGRRFVNAYGPTEATVCATAAVGPVASEPVSVGDAIDGVHVYLLDDNLVPVPEGAVGQAFVGGMQVANGYIERPAATAAVFLPDPFTGGRMYATGDLMRREPDGLVYLGRCDDQMKVRGIRIEPAEIQAALVRHPDVTQAAVDVRGSGSAARLIAWVVSDRSDDGLPDEVRLSATQVLPATMMPDRIIRTATLPLSTSGKVDRKALVEPVPKDVQPLTGLQAEIASIFSDVLGGTVVGARDKFFEVGGNSLRIAALFNRLQTAYPDVLSMGDLFEASTVEAISDRIAAHAGSTPRTSVVTGFEL